MAAPDRPLESERLRVASARLAHRGPDDLGYLGWDGAGAAKTARDVAVCAGARLGLAHRRLAILDLTEGGWQPMSSPDGHLHIVFNGEIYNYRELRLELERGGREFTTESDTEVLLAAYAAWGKAALVKLIGMFAFAVLDCQQGKLVLARDFFGIKPLYYATMGGRFAFASEIEALLGLVGARPRINPQRLFHYLRFGLSDHGGETLLAGIEQLPAAHLLEVSVLDRAVGRPERYWEIDLDRRCDLPFEAAAERLRELFLDNVRLHLRSDVPVGAALSGGVDSSAIVMAMRHLRGERLDLQAVSYDAEDERIGERPWIDRVAGAAGAVVHYTRPEPRELREDLERLIEVQGEPFGSTSIYAQHRVFRLAGERGIKVMLDGQGADELLGGYRGYLSARIVSLIRQGRPREASRFLSAARSLPETSLRDLLSGVGYALLPQACHRLARRMSGRPIVPGWLAGDWFAQRGVDLRSPLPRPRGRQALRDSLWQTLSSSSLPVLLRYEDRNSMAFSIESRVPFLTPETAGFILSLPEEYLIAADGTSKAVFRRAMRGIVPDVVLDRRDKIGFQTPERSWLIRLGDWVEQTLDGDGARAVPAIDREGARREWRAIVAGSGRFDWHVWRWINLIRWVERYEVEFGG